jgi:peptidoglycan/xylan/chitin deacetylase (PgdA/CDA1 family)
MSPLSHAPQTTLAHMGDQMLARPRRGVAVTKAALTRARSVWWHCHNVAKRIEPAQGVRIFAYHRVAPKSDFLTVSPDRFRRQMEAIALAGYVGVDVPAAVAALGSGSRTDIVGLTFDDGYLDVAEHALPILEEYGFRATVFVVPGVIDGRVGFSWYDDQPPVLGWEEIASLDGLVLEFEAHTLTHPNLLVLDDVGAKNEIQGSKAVLEKVLGRPVTVFCYPAGAYSEREMRLVAAAGFSTAVTVDPGLNTPGTHPLRLHRSAVEPTDALVDFRARMAGGHDSPLPLQSFYRRRRLARQPFKPA